MGGMTDWMRTVVALCGGEDLRLTRVGNESDSRGSKYAGGIQPEQSAASELVITRLSC